MNGSSLSTKLFAQNGKSLSSISGARETRSTLLLKLGLEDRSPRFWGSSGEGVAAAFWLIQPMIIKDRFAYEGPVHELALFYTNARGQKVPLRDLVGVEGQPLVFSLPVVDESQLHSVHPLLLANPLPA